MKHEQLGPATPRRIQKEHILDQETKREIESLSYECDPNGHIPRSQRPESKFYRPSSTYAERARIQPTDTITRSADITNGKMRLEIVPMEANAATAQDIQNRIDQQDEYVRRMPSSSLTPEWKKYKERRAKSA